MKVLQIGYGKMGKLTAEELLKNPDVTELFVYDIKFDKEYEKDGVHFVPTIDGLDIKSFDCAFVLSNVESHYTNLFKLIEGGVKNIFTEKPVLLNREEYDRINDLKGDCRIVSGYILRQSKPVEALKKIMKKMTLAGFKLEFCSVNYRKYLPVLSEERAINDMGVFDETVHIWDLLFNYLDFKNAECKNLNKYFECDPLKKSRCIYAELSYRLEFEKYTAMLNIVSSFKSKDKKRQFILTYKNDTGEKRTVYLSFDNPDNRDKLEITDGNQVIYSENYPSLNKLKRQIENIFVYFKNGKSENLALFEDDGPVIDFFESVRDAFEKLMQ